MSKETKVFIAGSRRLSRLNKDVLRRLDNVLEKHFKILIGDANGVDKAVQIYLASQHYDRVRVFCMEGICRNNIGHWRTETVPAPTGSRHDFAFFAAKDRAMAREADYGLMLWDGESRGTLTTILDLARQEKPVVVFFAPSRTLHNVRSKADLAPLLRHIAPETLQRAEGDIGTLAPAGSIS